MDLTQGVWGEGGVKGEVGRRGLRGGGATLLPLGFRSCLLGPMGKRRCEGEEGQGVNWALGKRRYEGEKGQGVYWALGKRRFEGEGERDKHFAGSGS